MQDMLEQLRPWLISKARSFTKDPGLQQDLAQEGWIAAWRTLKKDESKDNPLSYAKTAALWRMTNIFTNRTTPIGAEKRSPGAKVNGIPTELYNEFSEPAKTWSELKYVNYALELAYHYGQIHEAIAALPKGQRSYVFRRFWMDEGDSAGSRGNWNGTKSSRGAKEILAEKLEHLKEVM